MPSTSDKWKHFERLVTAIHQAADQGAEVRWNETINERQFDVTIRFKKGLYEYLTVVECKNYEKAIPVEKVEAFVTKAAHVRADRAVMASTSVSILGKNFGGRGFPKKSRGRPMTSSKPYPNKRSALGFQI